MSEERAASAERYVALGDSYTIGEGARADEAWPNLLVAHLREHGIAIDLVANPSVTGWTTAQVIEHELPVFEAADPTFATLLIGVNDWVQDVPEEDFRRNLGIILDRVQEKLPDPRRILLATIPDFSVTPAGATYSKGRDIPAGIAGFNDIISQCADIRSLPIVDIYPLTRQLSCAAFIASDELHPSAAAYARWEEVIFPVALQLLTS